eukprot:UN04396
MLQYVMECNFHVKSPVFKKKYPNFSGDWRAFFRRMQRNDDYDDYDWFDDDRSRGPSAPLFSGARSLAQGYLDLERITEQTNNITIFHKTYQFFPENCKI